MKFTAFALFLGCSALALQSDYFHFQIPALNGFTRMEAALERFRFVVPAIPRAPKKGIPHVNSQVTRAVPMLSKEETLALIADSAERYGVPAAFVASIVAAESNFNCAAVSPKGAVGLMQLMPETAQQYGADPAVPAENIDAGTQYLRWLMQRYHNHHMAMQKAIAAYNAGPGVVDRYHGIPPYHETRCYVTRVMSFMKQYSSSRKHPANSRG
jgi:soluble lytic murein transglycosylase-like protein